MHTHAEFQAGLRELLLQLRQLIPLILRKGQTSASSIQDLDRRTQLMRTSTTPYQRDTHHLFNQALVLRLKLFPKS